MSTLFLVAGNRALCANDLAREAAALGVVQMHVGDISPPEVLGDFTIDVDTLADARGNHHVLRVVGPNRNEAVGYVAWHMALGQLPLHGTTPDEYCSGRTIW